MKKLEISGLRKTVSVHRTEEEQKQFEEEFEKFVKIMDKEREDSIYKSLLSRIAASKVVLR
ncbi:MAG: hypothetical protein LBT24_05800 [Tannerella sp.]|jgi:hypothetical protein|nr:hypothetical protein [Tannerella sp.]